MREQFICLLRRVERSGIDNLLAFLDESDFYRAPASSQHHGAHEGGLLEHSLAVYKALECITVAFPDKYFNPDTMIIVALLHDICKANFYKIDYRNKKNELGQWERVPYYAVEDQHPYGHGEKSVDIIRDYIELTTEERMAIRWHMGGWEDSARGYTGQQAQSTAMKKYPLITALHMADLAATFFDGK